MLHELSYAVRRLRSRPAHTAIVVGVFAIGTGAALTVLRIADAVLLRPLPYADADRLVRISMRMPIVPKAEMPFSDVGIRALERRTHSFTGLAAYWTTGVNVTYRERAHRMLSARVTGNFFTVLGLPPRLGRGFEPQEETQGKPPQIVLSDRVWRETFGADPKVVGATVRVDGIPATIVGVADPHLIFPNKEVAYWALMSLDPVGTAPYNLGLEAIAHLKPGVSALAANVDATEVMRQVTRENPGPHSTADADVSGFYTIMRPMRDEMVGGIKPTLYLLGAAVVFVLLLTCVNVATLELVRSSGRRAELAIRAALGAGQSRLIVGSIAEGALQSSAGGVAGLALSGAAVRVLQSLVPEAFGADATNSIGWSMLLWAALAIVVCTAASAVFPVAAAMRRDLQSGLRERGGGGTPRLNFIRRSLIIVQVAAACLLVDGAMMMNLSLRESQRVPLGFEPRGLAVFRLSLPQSTYPGRVEVAAAYRVIVDRLRTIPGVVNVGLTTTVPLAAEQQDALVGIEGRPFRSDGTDPQVDYRIVSAGYFGAMGIDMVEGRGFSEGDAYLDGTPVLINKTMAKDYFAGVSPIGQRIRTGPFSPWMPVIGVVKDAKNRSLTQPPRPEMYIPFAAPRSPMRLSRDMSIVIRTSNSPKALLAAAQRVARETNPDLPLYAVRTFEEVIGGSQVREVTTTRTLTGFAFVALALAIAGSYAMLMFAVVQRKPELALRQAIGASGASLVRMIAAEMARLLAVGIVIGLVATMLASRLLSAFLFKVTPLDARVSLGTVAIIGLAGLVAAIIPARRAGAVDPMLVLRD